MKLFRATKPTDIISSSSDGYKTFHAIRGMLFMLDEAPNIDFEEIIDSTNKMNALKKSVDAYNNTLLVIYGNNSFNGKKLTKGQHDLIEYLVKELNG